MDKAFLAAKNAMVDVTEDLMPDDDITDVMVTKVLNAYDKAKLSDTDRQALKSMLDPTANDRRLIELAVGLVIELAPDVYEELGERFLTVASEDGEQRDISLGECP